MNDELIHVMRERFPKGSTLVTFLMDILSMGKEAVYRRLRGDVAFTFEEAVMISRSMNISLDKIAGNQFTDGITFDLAISHTDTDLGYYQEMVERYYKLCEFMSKDPTSRMCGVYNMMPYTFYAAYESLLRFRLYRWAYHNGYCKPTCKISELEIPDKLIERHKSLATLLKQIPYTCFIWDNNVFSSIVKEIRYFASLNLISQADLNAMKSELLQLLDYLEILSLKGHYENGNSLYIYLSSINFETTYVHFEKKDFHISLFKVFSINSIDTQNDMVCKTQKDWIESLKRHSNLISQSGEMQRIAFLIEQREIINLM